MPGRSRLRGLGTKYLSGCWVFTISVTQEKTSLTTHPKFLPLWPPGTAYNT